MATTTTPTLVEGTFDAITTRVAELQRANLHTVGERRRIRNLLNGGAAAIRELLGEDALEKLGTDHIPVANLMVSGLDRLSQRVGAVPDIKVDPRTDQDTDRARLEADKRERIVAAYDRLCRLELLLPQAARWLAGYGFCFFVVRPRRYGDHTYPVLELRNPYGVYLDSWGNDQTPQDAAAVWRMSPRRLQRLYPNLSLDEHHTAVLSNELDVNWESNTEGVVVVEYFNETGTYLVVPAAGRIVDFIPNPCQRPPFVAVRRYAFDQLKGQYDHIVGLMAAIAKMNILAEIAVEDATFREALTLDTPIPTPQGWTTMGDLKVGDVILGPDGMETTVIAATEPQHDRKLYRVTFQDGTWIDASDGHLWLTKTINGQRIKIRTTEEMHRMRSKLRVPAAKPWKLPEADLPIDPYLLGCWLGDGIAAQAIITVSDDDAPHFVAAFRRTGHHVTPRSYKQGVTHLFVTTDDGQRGVPGTGITGRLNTLGLLNNKHIPPVYLRASLDQRLALLQGLMDTDGCVSKNGHCSISTTHRRLAHQIIELLRTLGEVPNLYTRVEPRCRTGEMFEINWTARHHNPATLPRKAERVRFHRRGPDWVTITNIEPIPTRPVRCIAVDNPDRLFLAGEGAHTTHNTNIIGDIESGSYKRGRFAVNYFAPGTRIERASQDIPFAAFQQIDRLERMLRIGANYNVLQDAISPNSFVTGRGMDRLDQSADLNVEEYQKVLRWALQDLDWLRLEYDEQLLDEKKPLPVPAEDGAEQYIPSVDIDGQYWTRRVYGVMATWDEPTKIVTALQLLQAGVLDVRTIQENLKGLEEIGRINNRIVVDRIDDGLMGVLAQRATEGDPAALQALIEIREHPDRMNETLKRFFTPEEPQLSPEEQQFLQTQQRQQLAAQGEAPPPVTTVLSRLEQTGGVAGGIQTVGRLNT